MLIMLALHILEDQKMFSFWIHTAFLTETDPPAGEVAYVVAEVFVEKRALVEKGV